MPDYDTRQRKRNMIVGGFVIVAFCAFLYLLFMFGELPKFVSKWRSFVILVNFANAPGVQKNTPVRYCGYQIGRVTGVSPPFLFTEPDTGRSYHQVKVQIAIEKQYIDIPSHVKIFLMTRGLGSSYIEFEVDADKEITDVLREGDVLTGYTGVSSEFFPKAVQIKLENLVDSISGLADHITTIIGDPQNQTNIKQTLANMTVMTGQATEALKSIKEFSDASAVKIADVSEQLSDTLVELQGIMAKINNGESTMAKLLNDGRLYENLLDSSEELKMALEQLKIVAAETREKGIRIKLGL